MENEITPTPENKQEAIPVVVNQEHNAPAESIPPKINHTVLPENDIIQAMQRELQKSGTEIKKEDIPAIEEKVIAESAEGKKPGLLSILYRFIKSLFK